MMNSKLECLVISQEMIAKDIYSLVFEGSDIAKESRPGQFVNVYTKSKSNLLPRPISICEAAGDRVRLVYRAVGAGTKEFSTYKAGDTITVLGPLGNGYDVESVSKDRKAILFGGGIGIPPMLELSKRLGCEVTAVLGYRDELFLDKEFTDAADMLYVATEDGSAGTRGNVLDAVREKNIEGDIIFACGPTPMLRAIRAYAQEKNIEAYVSLEERMACGVGACLACVCKSADIDDHSQVKNKRVCKDGPVFNIKDIEI